MLSNTIRKIAQALALIAGVSLILIMLQTVSDIGMSRLFNKPIEGNIEIISGYHMVFVVFLPLAFVELRHEHINADLFVRTFPKGLQRVVYIFGAVVSLIFFSILIYQTWLDAVESWKISEVVMGSIYVPIWPAKFSLPIGFLAILLAICSNIAQAVVDPDFSPTPPEPSLD